METKHTHRDEIERLEAELSLTEAKLQVHYSQMGKNLLELADSEQRVIGGLVDEIVKKKARLSEARNEKQCPECMVYNSSDSQYCKHCGEKLPTAPPAEKEKKNGTEKG